MIEVTALTTVQVGVRPNLNLYRQGDVFDLPPDQAQRLFERKAVAMGKVEPAATPAIAHEVDPA